MSKRSGQLGSEDLCPTPPHLYHEKDNEALFQLASTYVHWNWVPGTLCAWAGGQKALKVIGQDWVVSREQKEEQKASLVAWFKSICSLCCRVPLMRDEI